MFLQVSIGQKMARGADFIQFTQRLAAAARGIAMLAVHAVAFVVNALHVLVDALDDFLGILGGQ